MPGIKVFANASSTTGPTIQDVAEYIIDKKVNNIIVLVGAGVSTSAGIPDFRSPDTGLYANLEKYELPYPEAIFDLAYFYERPEAFFTLAKELFPGNYLPTLSHYFFVLLHQKEVLKRVFSQNVDTLERQAGLPEEMLVEAHGSFASATCCNCKKKWQAEDLKDRISKGQVLRCDEQKCKGVKRALIKSDIVFFGEALPSLFFNRLSDFASCDLLITIGTSLKVQPFASLIDRVDDNCPRLLINLESVGEIDSLEDEDGGGGIDLFARYREEGFDFIGSTRGGKEKARDARYLGKADEGVKELARALGWEKELLELYEKGHAELKAKSKVPTRPTSPKEEASKVAAEVAKADTEAGKDERQTEGAREEEKGKFDELAKELDKLGVTDGKNDKGESESGKVDIGVDTKNDGKDVKDEKKASL